MNWLKEALTWCTASRWADGKCSSATRRPYNGACLWRDASGPATKDADTESSFNKRTIFKWFARFCKGFQNLIQIGVIDRYIEKLFVSIISLKNYSFNNRIIKAMAFWTEFLNSFG